MEDLIIIGAGASGLFFSINTPSHIKKTILEKSDKIGSKVLMS
ncbi:TPA: hypothetical protein DEP21_05550 [Patescibacteria group bacterium]|nr:hypothetical protein [Candidatus Gracilibacteria bacterium]